MVRERAFTMQHHRMNKYSCGEQALAVDILKSAVQEI